jgi:PIN domain nuclease of toxin-antitoxin system
MNLLLDTNVFIHWFLNTDRLSKALLRCVNRPRSYNPAEYD